MWKPNLKTRCGRNDELDFGFVIPEVPRTSPYLFVDLTHSDQSYFGDVPTVDVSG